MQNRTRKNPFLLAPTMMLLLMLLFMVFRLVSKGGDGYLTAVIWIAGLLILMWTVFFAMRGLRGVRRLGVWRFSFREFALVLAGAMVYIGQNTLLKTAVFPNAFSEAGYRLYGEAFLTEPKTTGDHVLMLVALVVLPAIFEEFFFRGILVFEYRYGGAFGAVLMSSFLYACLETSLAGAATAFVGGLVFAWIFLITGNLFSVILLHTVTNLFTLYAEPILRQPATSPDSSVLFAILMLFILFVGIVFLVATAESVLRMRAECGDAPFPRVPREKRAGVRRDMLTALPLLVVILLFGLTILVISLS